MIKGDGRKREIEPLLIRGHELTTSVPGMSPFYVTFSFHSPILLFVLFSSPLFLFPSYRSGLDGNSK